MAAYDPGLGNLSVLPPELRLCIYDWIPPLKYKTLKRPGPRGWKGPLAILCTSRTIYNEFSHLLYLRRKIIFEVTPKPGPYCITAWMPDLFKRPWYFQWREHLKRGAFRKFPYHKVKAEVHVSPPDPNDPGQLTVLWHKLNKLVDLFAKSTSNMNITLCLRPSEEYSWVGNGIERGQVTVKLHNMPSPDWAVKTRRFQLARDIYDHEVIFLPFCHLLNVRNIRIRLDSVCSAEDVHALDWSLPCFAIHHLFKVRCSGRTEEQEKAIAEIHDVMSSFQSALSTRLNIAFDELSGRTACKFNRSPSLANHRAYRWCRKTGVISRRKLTEKYGEKSWSWPQFTVPDRDPVKLVVKQEDDSFVVVMQLVEGVLDQGRFAYWG